MWVFLVIYSVIAMMVAACSMFLDRKIVRPYEGAPVGDHVTLGLAWPIIALITPAIAFILLLGWIPAVITGMKKK